MAKMPHAGRDDKPRLPVQELLVHLANYYAETNPTERRIFERAFVRWFRIYAEDGDPLAKELLADPNWMHRFPALVFNNNGPIDLDFIRSRLAIPNQLSDERDLFWRARTRATGEIGQYLDAAYERAVQWDFDAERSLLLDALYTCAKHDNWAAIIREGARAFDAGAPNHIAGAAGVVLFCCRTKHYRSALAALARVIDGEPRHHAPVEIAGFFPILLDVLFKAVPDAELYFRERARRRFTKPQSRSGQ